MPRTKEDTTVMEPRSRRARDRMLGDVLTPLQQIPVLPGNNNVEATGAWAYYLRPDGATIAETLILYPNGGTPDIDDQRMKVRYGTNAAYYQERQRNKGMVYVGQTLTEGGIRQLVDVMAKNRPEEIAFCEDEIDDAKEIAANSDIPEVRAQAKRRIAQFQRRLEYLTQPLDEEALLSELNEIARAQMLAKVDPNILRVMRSMLGEVNAKMEASILHFQAGRGSPGGEGAPHLLKGDGSDPDQFKGKDVIE